MPDACFTCLTGMPGTCFTRFTRMPDACFTCLTGMPSTYFAGFVRFTGGAGACFVYFAGFACAPDTCFTGLTCFCPLNGYDASPVMEGEIIERTVQMNRGSFILTIPQAIAREAGIRKGQGVRFRVGDGEIVISPTCVLGGGAPDSVGPDKYERAIEEMMAKNESERSGGRGAASGKSKLERLRLK